MAIVKFGVPIVGARGTIGGIIFTANKAGPYARIWSKGSNPRTAPQSEQRGILTTFASNWRNLTQVQRDDWDDYADDPAQELTNSLGEDYFISGFNWYVRINTHLELAGEADRDDAPTLTRPVAPTIAASNFHITGSANNTQYTLAFGSPGLTSNNVALAQVVSSQGILPVPARMPLISIQVPDGSRQVFIQTELEATFGTLSLGQRLLFSSQIQDAHGQRGPADTDTADAQA